MGRSHTARAARGAEPNRNYSDLTPHPGIEYSVPGYSDPKSGSGQMPDPGYLKSMKEVWYWKGSMLLVFV